MVLTKDEKKEFAELFWLTQVYGQVSSRDLQRLQQLENKLSDEQSDRLEYLMNTKFDEDKYKPTAKQIFAVVNKK